MNLLDFCYVLICDIVIIFAYVTIDYIFRQHIYDVWNAATNVFNDIFDDVSNYICTKFNILLNIISNSLIFYSYKYTMKKINKLNDTISFPNPLLERQQTIIQLFNNFFPGDISKLICEYDYYLEMKAMDLTLDSNLGTTIIYDVLMCKKINTSDSLKVKTKEIYNIVLKVFNKYTFNIFVISEEIIIVQRSDFIFIVINFRNRTVTDLIDTQIMGNLYNRIIKLSDGRIIDALDECTIRICDPKTNSFDNSFIGHSSIINCMKLLPDGRLASCSDDGRIKVWNMETGLCDITFDDVCFVECIVALADEKGDFRLVSGNFGATIKVWNVVTKNCDITFKGHSRSISCINVLSDGRVVSGSHDTTIKVWNTRIGNCDMTFSGHSRTVSCIAVLPYDRIISGSFDCTLNIWNTRTGQCEATLKGHSKPIRSITVLSDGRFISKSFETNKLWY
jgi:WD40 repeat protein